MAHRLDSFDFSSERPAGRPPKYPWHEWTDGSIWRVIRGIDYEPATRSLQATLFAYAGRVGLKVRTKQVTVDGREGLVFQFFEDGEPPAGEQARHADDRYAPNALSMTSASYSDGWKCT